MSKTSWFYVCAMVAIVTFVGATRGYRAYENYKQQKEEEAVSDFTFQNIPITLGAPQAEPASKPVPYMPQATQDIFLGDTALPPEQETKQADLTLQSIFDDYRADPALVAFNQELSRLTQGQANSLEDLSGPRLTAVIQTHPEVQQLIQKHLQNPQFSMIVGQIFSNPQYVQSVQVLQGKSSVFNAQDAK